MVRLRKGKGQFALQNPVPRADLALGGNEEDMELLKGLNGNEVVSGSQNDDPALQKDLSKFLKELNLKPEPPKSKGKRKEKPEPSKPDAPKPSKEKKDKKSKGSAQKPDAQPSQPKADAASSDAPPPKVQLPTKVSLNPKSRFVFQPISLWHAAVPSLSPTSSKVTISPDQLSKLSAKTAELHEADLRTFQTSSSANSSSSEASFLQKIIQSGTLSDRLSALTLLVQSSPLHNTKALETLKGMAERGKGKGGREESLKALRCIVDWWVGGGAPNRKLVYFRDQPLLHADVTDEVLLVWYFEDWLKKYFFSVLQILETLSLDPLPYVRTQTINLIFTLSGISPNKNKIYFGDTEKSLASRASYHLLQLLQAHPAMKGIVVNEIISLILRPLAGPATGAPAASASTSTSSGPKHIRFTDAEPSKPASAPNAGVKPKPKAAAEKKGGNAHARYYATVTFNQVVLTPADRDVAVQLIDIYFEIFKELLGEGSSFTEGAEGGEADENEKEFKTDKGGRVMDGKPKGKGKAKAKQSEVKGAAGFTEVEDANSKLISAILTGVNRALPFAKLTAGDTGIDKHMDTLFLITHTSTFNISLQALVLIQHITASLSAPSSEPVSSSSSSLAKSITDRYYRTLYASLHDTRLAASSKQAMYLNLFFKSVKTDAGNANNERVRALVRRFVQVLVSAGSAGATEFVAGGLFLLGELFSTTPGLRGMINEKPKKDVEEAYDPKKREPQFAHASALPLWELTPLLNHYHPAVALHARQLLSSQPLTASADLSQNTLSHFLDRFVYKNPKKVKEGEMPGGRGPSAMQPAASALEGVKLVKGEVGAALGIVNEKEFLRKKREDVPVDQLFFHQYFTSKDEREKAKAAKVKKRKEGKEDELSDEDEDGDDEELGEEQDVDDDSAQSDAEDEAAAEAASDVDEDEDASDLEEAEIWKVMQATMPKGDGDDDYLMNDSDVDEDDDAELLDYSDNEDDQGAEEDGDGDEDISQNEDSDEDDGGEDDLSLAEASDNEDLIPLDDMPDGLIEYDGSDASDDDDGLGRLVEEEVWGGITANDSSGNKGRGKKRQREEEEKSKKRKKLKLPTFASYEDYAKLIEEGPEDDI
ncbi:CBF/Mak21 family-domain-containing protein [Gymnopilus junonius]|uniref:CBF/Mak21 family-domain-containing protein n=1 Tax=Gymnopilus junonius TaxID=109634 RepID=A0A9P5TL73_GYMJU|nr:CBF/Mak21 family-domain-containing protein [Gymnopilus junonius]